MTAATLVPPVLAQSSGCDICASTGDCSHAFHNGAGQFCGSFVSPTTRATQPCCCPLGTICKLSPHKCQCHVPGNQPTPHHGSGSGGYPPPPNNNNYNPHQEEEAEISGIVSLLVLICCCCCCLSRIKRCCGGREREGEGSFGGRYPGDKYQPSGGGVHPTNYDETVPMAPPAYNPNYQHGGGPSAPPSYGATVYDHNTTTSDNDGGRGSWLSGLGGFLTGAALGSTITHGWDRRHENNNNDNYGGGGGGGSDIAGDTGGGGYYGGGGGGGYDIDGDTGYDDGGGYDIEGDS
jgi:hypothetical protein